MSEYNKQTVCFFHVVWLQGLNNGHSSGQSNHERLPSGFDICYAIEDTVILWSFFIYFYRGHYIKGSKTYICHILSNDLYYLEAKL